MRVTIPKLPPELDQLNSPQLVAAFTLENIEVTGVDWVRQEAKRVSFDAVRFLDPDFTSSILRDGGWADIEFNSGMLAGTNLAGSSLRRIQVSNVRASGIIFSETEGRDIAITDSKLDVANFRFATWSRVTFVRCSLSEADFAGANLKDVSFTGCDLTGCDFSGAILHGVDLRGSKLENLKGLSGLKGAIINTAQLIGLASSLAGELGIKIEDSAAIQHDSHGSGKVQARNSRLHWNSNS